MQQQLQVNLSHIIHVQISILSSLMPNYHWLKSVSLILFRAVMTVMTVTNKQYKIGSVTSSHYSIHFKRSVWVPIPIQVLERCIPTIKMCQKSPKILSIRFELGSWKKSRYLINLRGEKENMCREAEKCRVRSRSSSQPTGLFSANQLTGCLWMIDSKGNRLAQRGGRVKLPQTTPGQTSYYAHTQTHFSRR